MLVAGGGGLSAGLDLGALGSIVEGREGLVSGPQKASYKQMRIQAKADAQSVDGGLQEEHMKN